MAPVAAEDQAQTGFTWDDQKPQAQASGFTWDDAQPVQKQTPGTVLEPNTQDLSSPLQAPPAPRAPDTIQAAPAPSLFNRARQSVANSTVGRSIESTMPKAAAALGLEPTESEASPTYQQDKTSLPQLPAWANTPLVTADKALPGPVAARIRQSQQNLEASHPIAGAILKGGQEAAEGLTSPANLALLAVAPEARPISAFFATQAAQGAFQNAEQAYQAWRQGQNPAAAKYLTEAGLNAIIAGLAGTHALKGASPVDTARPSVSDPKVEVPNEPRQLPAPPQAEYVGEPPAPKPTGPAPIDAEFTWDDEKKPAQAEKPATPTAPVQTAPDSERPQVQGSTEPKEIKQSAEQQKPVLQSMAEHVAAQVPGAEVVEPRVKTLASMANKEDRDKPAGSNWDNLGGRIISPNPDAVPAVQEAIEKNLPVVSKDKIDSNGLQMPQYAVQTGKPGEANQVSELQVVPSPKHAEAIEKTDDLYAEQKKAEVAGDTAKAAEIGEQIKAQMPGVKVGDSVTYVTSGGKERPAKVERIDGNRAQLRDKFATVWKPLSSVKAQQTEIAKPSAVQAPPPEQPIPTQQGAKPTGEPRPVGEPIPVRVAQVRREADTGKKFVIFSAEADNPEVHAALQKEGLGDIPVSNIKGPDFGAMLDNLVNVKKNANEEMKIPEVPAGKAVYIDFDGTLFYQRDGDTQAANGFKWDEPERRKTPQTSGEPRERRKSVDRTKLDDLKHEYLRAITANSAELQQGGMDAVAPEKADDIRSRFAKLKKAYFEQHPGANGTEFGKFVNVPEGVDNAEPRNGGQPHAADEAKGGGEETNVRQQSAEGLLQRQPEEDGGAGGGRGRVEPGEQGETTPRKSEPEEKPLDRQDAKEEGFKLTTPPADLGVKQYIQTLPRHWREYARAAYKELVAKGGGHDADGQPNEIETGTGTIPRDEMGDIEKLDDKLRDLADKVAKGAKQEDNGSREDRTTAAASVDQAGGGRPAAEPRSEDRQGLEPVPSRVLQDTEGRGEPRKGSAPDRADVRGDVEPVSKQGTRSGSGKGSDTGIDRTPGGPVAKEATAPKTLNRNWYTHPDNWKPPTGTVGRLEANLAAIRILRDVEKNPRKLTDAERDALANYVGWGALPHTFAPYGAPRDEQGKWSKANSELQKLLSPDELARAQESTKNAHYTSPELVRFMWDTMQRFGFKAGDVLEPSVGNGNFLGMMPKAIRAKINAVTNELDTITHGIAKLLYPEATNFNKDFADLILPDNSFDLAIGNPPFGGYKLYDPAYKKLDALVHDFFFVKSLDKVRPGGVLAFITSTGTMDKASATIRNILASKANLLGVIRLPSGAFKSNAGTDVTTDLIFLQKRAPGEEADHADDWLASSPMELPGRYNMEKVNVNEYFQKHPEMMLGRPTASTKMYGGVGFLLEPHEGKDIVELLKEAQKELPRGIFKSPIQQATGNSQMTTAAEFAPDNIKQGQYVVTAKGELKQNIKGKLVDPEAVLDKSGSPIPTKVKRMKALVGVRDHLNLLLATMLSEPDDEEGNRSVALRREELEKEYNRFVSKFGYLNGIANNLFRDDPHYPRLLALENWDRAARKGTPADIFRRRTIFPREELRSLPSDPKEALQLILAERGFPDVQMMARLRGEKVDDIVKSLGDKGLIYRNPSSGNYETRETYLSGYVRDKLRDAKRAVAQGNKEYAPNVTALEKVVPADIEISDDPKSSVSVRLGSTWIPTDALEQFIRNEFKSPGTVKYLMGNWKVDGVRNTAEVSGLYGTPRVSADAILEDSLNLKQVMVYDHHTDGSRTLNTDATTAAQAAQQKLREAFQKWAVQSKEWKPELQRLYNDAYNNLAQVEYDGSHLTFPGMNPSIKLQPHQVNAVWRILQDGRALLAHVVGAGKTFEMAAAIMEGRRVGTFKKPMLTVPNHIVEQFRQEFLHLYPGANLLVPAEQEFDSKNRQRIMSRIATGDYDAIILPHSQFNLMDISPERQRVTIQKQKDELHDTILSLKESHGEKRTIKQLEAAMAKLDASLKKLSDLKADKAIYFDDTGVDALFVDEAHLYKNLSFYTKMTRVAGLQQAKAKSALRLKMKTEFLQDRNNGRGVIFSTGTPIQNTMAELYTMMKYVAPDVLEKAGIRFFDDWAANFGSVITAMELSADGRSYKARAKFAQFQNVPELMNMFRSFADIKTEQDLNLPTPEMETGKPIVVPVPGSEMLEEYVKELMQRAEQVKSGSIDPTKDNMLKITTDGRKAATDMRLVDPSLPDDQDSKINTAVEKMYQEWVDGKNDLPEGPTTQMAFLDLYRSIHVDAEGHERDLVNLYRDMRNKLMDRGVPPEQIAVIGDYDTRIKRQQLFAAMNKGEVRILLGSTQKMGAGTNAQRLMKALHHIDLTWRPGDLAQRNGRIIRQGNLNPSVRLYNYLTERSFDAYMAQTLQGKAEFISQIMSGRISQRVMADVASEMVLSLEEMKIAASGNPDVKLQYDLQMQKAQLESLRRSFDSQRRANAQEAQSAESRVARLRGEIEKLDVAQKAIKAIEGTGEEKGLKVQLDGKTFTDRKSLNEYLELMEVPPGNFHMEWNGVGVSVEREMRLDTSINKSYLSLGYRFSYDRIIHYAPKVEMLSLARSLEARMRNIGDELEAKKTEIPRLTERAQRLSELAEQKDFPEKDKLDQVNKDLDAVEKRLGMKSDAENAMAQAVTAEVKDDPEDDLLSQGPDEGEAEEEPDEKSTELTPEQEDEEGRNGSNPGTTMYSGGFLDPTLFKELFPDIAQRMKEWISDKPSSGDLQREMMRETRGEKDRGIAAIAKKLQPTRNKWTLRSRDDSKEFWNAVESGNVASLDPADRPLAVFFYNGFKPLIEEIQELKPEALREVIENYFPHIWENPSIARRTLRSVISGKRPFAGSGAFLKKRTVPTMQDGLDMGLTPVSWNPVDLFIRKYAEMSQFLMAHKTLAMMKDAGTAKFVRVNSKAPDGWRQLDDRIGTVYGREKAVDEEKLDEATYDKTYVGGKRATPSVAREDIDDATHDVMTIRGHYYAPEQAARVFNNFVSRGLRGRFAVYDVLRWANDNLNALQLGISAFHASTTAVNAATSEVAIGIEKMFQGKPFQAFGNLLSGLSIAPSVIRTMVNGSKLMREYLTPGSYAKMHFEANAIATAGGRAKMDLVEDSAMRKTVNAFRNGAIGEGLTSVPGAILQSTVAPVMDWMVPRMKMGAFYDMAHNILDQADEKGWDAEEVRRRMQRAWDSIDNRFGQMVYDNLFWHRAVRDSLALATRSVGWNAGDIRELGGAVADTAKAAGQAAQGKMPEVSHRMAFAAALAITTALMGGVLTYLWTGHKPDTWKDYYYPKRKDGTRVSIPGYMKDVIAFREHPVGTVTNKMSPLLELTAEAIQNRDFYGTEIRHQDDPFVKQMMDVAKWAAISVVPFSIAGARKLLSKEGEDTSTFKGTMEAAMRHPGDVVLGQLGFQPAPAVIQNSDALNKAREYEQANRPTGTRTAEQTQKLDAMRTVEDMYRAGNVNRGVVASLKSSGKLSETDLLKAKLYARTDPIVAAAKGLSPAQLLNVYKLGTPEEQKKLRERMDLMQRELNQKVTDPEEREQLRQAYRNALHPLATFKPASL